MFRNLQRNSSVFTNEALSNLERAETISAASARGGYNQERGRGGRGHRFSGRGQYFNNRNQNRDFYSGMARNRNNNWPGLRSPPGATQSGTGDVNGAD